MAIVTRKSLTEMLDNSNPAYVQAVIGRALVVIFKNQTADEQTSNETKHDNGIGFTGADARAGTLTAKYFLKHQRLEDWMIDNWKRKGSKGFPRLAKYHAQINKVAKAK